MINRWHMLPIVKLAKLQSFRPVNELHVIALQCAHTCQYLCRRTIIACAKLYMIGYSTPMLQQVCSDILLQVIHLQLHVMLSFHS